jgi:transcriptional regulator with XRE-family HTH domain
MSNIVHSQAQGERVLGHLAENLRRLRTAAGLSQAALAERSGLGRRTITALEAGDINISLARLDRIADALGTTFVALVRDPAASTPEVPAWRGASPASAATLLGAAPATREVQFWRWSLAPSERYQAEPDPEGWREMIYVVEGTLHVDLEDRVLVVEAGNLAIYGSAQSYAYFNPGENIVRFVRNVVA